MSALNSGDKLGPYEILSPLGAGGMGEVYRATDSTLDREVAIKVLPDLFARDPERIQRFKREAKVLASLNHPNIAAIYGFEEAEGKRFLVMELVEGETLAERLKISLMPVEEALQIGKQIAEALEAAHERGIIHRDLKPANIKITPEGKVKVLDFGLAKAMANESTQMDIENSPTITADFTRPGVVMGTAAYMSPEQARGKPLDKRTDIWSYGCVFYECLVGERAFNGETNSDLMAEILKVDPDWDTLPHTIPPNIQMLLKRCLQKDRKQRLRDIGEAWVVIDAAIAGDTSMMGLAAYEAPRTASWKRLLPWSITVVLAITAAALWLIPRSTPTPTQRFSISIPENQVPKGMTMPTLAISPDGQLLVYRGQSEMGTQLYLRRINQLETRPIAHTKDAINPFFSRDSQWICFATKGKLKKISIHGGPAVSLADVKNMRGGHWGPNNMIVFAPDNKGGLSIVSGGGGTVTSLTESLTSASHRWPQFLPDGQHVIFTAAMSSGSTITDHNIYVVNLETKEQRLLLGRGNSARYLPSGHLVYHSEGTLMGAAFDASKVQLTSQAVPVLEGVIHSDLYASSQWTVSNDGTLVFLAGSISGDGRIPIWVDRTGKEEILSQHQRNYMELTLSPDGKYIAIGMVTDSDRDIWILELARDQLNRLTFDKEVDRNPIWSADGEWIIYSSTRGGNTVLNLYRKRADGTGEVQRLTQSEFSQMVHAVTPDGKQILFTQENEKTGSDVYVLTLDDDQQNELTGDTGAGTQLRKTTPLLQTTFTEVLPSISPDGKWIAYTSNESGDFENYVQSWPELGAKIKISDGLGWMPRWSKTKNEIFYISTAAVYAVSYAVEEGHFRPQNPQELFKLPPNYQIGYDLAPDGATGSLQGERLIMVKTKEGELNQRQPVVVTNWFKEVKEKVPTP